MKKNQYKLKKDSIVSFWVSILIHGLLFVFLIKITVENIHHKINENSVLSFTTVSPTNIKVPAKTKIETKRKEQPKHKKEKKKEEVNEVKQPETAATIDTTSGKKIYNTNQIENADSIKTDLKFAATLLDTFLVLHPEYRRYILEQQAKDMFADKSNKFFKRQTLEQKINDVIHKYIKENFPEGSEHAMNPALGPGVHIPIDGLIDAIKKIFK